jgi:hypothetical protein
MVTGTGLLSPTLTSLGGGEGEGAASREMPSLIQRQCTPALSPWEGERGNHRQLCGEPTFMEREPDDALRWYRQEAPD